MKELTAKQEDLMLEQGRENKKMALTDKLQELYGDWIGETFADEYSGKDGFCHLWETKFEEFAEWVADNI